MRRIESKDNKYIKLAASLKNKKYRDMENLFLVEGWRAVAEALKKPELLAGIFLDERRVEEYIDLEPVIKELFVLNPQLMRYICCTENPQGIAAMVKNPSWSWQDLLSRQGPLILLDRISDPGNMGSILRTCWALGVEGLILTRGSVDPFSPKVVRSTMGAIMNMPLFQDISEQQLDALQEQGYSLWGATGDAADNYFEVKYPSKTLLILGSEADGISDGLRKRCRGFIKIPMKTEVDSLNVAAACAIILAELWRQRQEGIRLA